MVMAIYNAGTDIVAGDPLGGLNISPQAILERDKFVVEELRRRQVPTVMLLSGGYTKQSFELIANSVVSLIGSATETIPARASAMATYITVLPSACRAAASSCP